MREGKFKKIFLLSLSIWLIIFSYNNYFKPIKINSIIDKNYEHYINDIYKTDAFRYNLLSNQEKILYKDLIEYYKDLQIKVNVDLSKYGCISFSECNVNIETVFEAIVIDHPELLQITSFSYSYEKNSPIINVDLMPISRNKTSHILKVRRVQRIIDNIRRKTENMTDLEKIVYVYEWMGANSKYDYLFKHDSKNQSAYNSLVKGSGVCASFAKASQLIFQNIGIESQLAKGYTSSPHMWNIIKYDGKYYHFDPTYASGKKKDSKNFYNGLIQTNFNKHNLNKPNLYPQLANDEFFKKDILN